MSPAFVLRIGKGKSALFLANAPFSSTNFHLTDSKRDAMALTRQEAEEIAAKYRQTKVDFEVVELGA